MVGSIIFYLIFSFWGWLSFWPDFVSGIETEEQLIGYKLTIHPSSEIFKKYLETDSFAREASKLNEYSIHHLAVQRFCKQRYENENIDPTSDNDMLNGCSYEEYYACLEIIREPFSKNFDPGRARVFPEEIIGLWYGGIDKKGSKSECARIDKPTREEFMSYVARSEPVIITGIANKWTAKKKWTWNYLLETLKDEHVIVSVSPNPYFDGPEEATLWDPEKYQKGDFVVARPAQLHITFEEYVQLLKSPYSDNSTFFYLQYMPLKLFNKGNLAKDIEKKSMGFADFLDEKLQLIWLGDGRNGGAIHNDKQENIMAMISGSKLFRLIPPLTDQREYLYAGMPMRGGSLKYGWTNEKDPRTGMPKAIFQRNADDLSEVNPHQSYTAVRVDTPDYERFPKSKNLNVIECQVNEGEMLYNPAHWWHEVTSGPDETGKSLGINWFFAPLYNHIITNDTFWEPNRNYMPIGRQLEENIALTGKPLPFNLAKLLHTGNGYMLKTTDVEHEEL